MSELPVHPSLLYTGPGDTEVDGILICGICGGPKSTPEGWPIVHQHQLEDGLFSRRETEEQRASRIAENRSCCYGVNYRELERARFRPEKDGGKEVGAFKYTAEDTDPEALQRCETFASDFEANRKQGRKLILYGHVGVGKTFLAACTANAVLAQGYKCRFTSLQLIRQNAGRWGGEAETIRGLRDADLVVLDDFLRERDTEWSRELAFSVVDALYNARVPLIVTTNASRDTIYRPPEHLRPVMDRIKQRGTGVNVTGPNRRQTKCHL